MALTEMAITENAKRSDGWQDQAEHLALSHVAVALTIMAAVERARRIGLFIWLNINKGQPPASSPARTNNHVMIDHGVDYPNVTLSFKNAN